MQTNVILAAAKIVVITIFAVFLGLNLFAVQNLEEKQMRALDKVEGLNSTVAETNRRVTAAQTEARAAKEAADRSYERLDALADVIARGGIAVRPGGGADGATDAGGTVGNGSAATDAAPKKGEPSLISGRKVWPRNPGWTVLCDKEFNDDPARELPLDKIDWSAELRAYVSGEPKGLNWYTDDRSVTVVNIARYTNEMLAERKTHDITQWSAKVAERIEESPDRTEYLIYLRRGVMWHRPAIDLDQYPWLKGQHEVDADDVVFTFNIVRNKAVQNPTAVYYEEIVSAEKVDKYTVRVKWSRPNFYARATTLELRPIPEHIAAYDQEGNKFAPADLGPAFNDHWFLAKKICGQGPYRFAEYRKGEAFIYERNENYWGPRPTCAKVTVSIIKDPETALIKFWNKELINMSLSSEQYRRVILSGDRPAKTSVRKFEDFNQAAPGDWPFTYFIWRRPVYGGFAWNMRRPVFKDREVRTAMTYALNRNAVVDKLFYGLGEQLPVGESVLSPYFPGHLKPLPYDLDKARAALAQAGWTDTDGDGIRDKVVNGEKMDCAFELVISASSPFQTSLSQMFKGDLLKCGVRLNVQPVDSALWAEKNSAREFDGLIIFWYAGIDSDPQQLWKSSAADEPGSNNYTGFKSKEADTIFDKLVTTFDMPERIKLMHRWYEIEHEEQPYTWIWSIHSPILMDANWRIPPPKLPPPYIDRRLIFKWKNR